MSNGNIQPDKIYEVLLADIRQRQTKLRQELAELDAAEQVMQATSNYRQQMFERIRSGIDSRPLSVEEIRDKSQRAILQLIAERNQGWLVVLPAIKLMVNADILTNETASAQVYTVLRQRRDQFEPIIPGIYRLLK